MATWFTIYMEATTTQVTFGGWICTGRYIGRCPSCKTLVKAESAPRQAHDTLVTCECGKSFLAKQVFGSVKESKKCDGRCTGATGFDCECSCGGHNHGIDAK